MQTPDTVTPRSCPELHPTVLPKREDPGFAAVSDKSVLSYYTVLENSFYSLQLLFACCYLSDDIRPLIRRTKVIEPLFVFFVFYMRHLWPSSRISASLNNAKNKSDKNRLTLTVSAYAIKVFYLLAKHFIGTFPLYLAYLGRLTEEDQRLLYGVQIVSAYASTISIFIHTLKFKRKIGPLTAMVAYDIIIPAFAFLYYNMAFVIVRNYDIAMICFVALILNLAPKVGPVRRGFFCFFVFSICGCDGNHLPTFLLSSFSHRIAPPHPTCCMRATHNAQQPGLRGRHSCFISSLPGTRTFSPVSTPSTSSRAASWLRHCFSARELFQRTSRPSFHSLHVKSKLSLTRNDQCTRQTLRQHRCPSHRTIPACTHGGPA